MVLGVALVLGEGVLGVRLRVEGCELRRGLRVDGGGAELWREGGSCGGMGGVVERGRKELLLPKTEDQARRPNLKPANLQPDIPHLKPCRC